MPVKQYKYKIGELATALIFEINGWKEYVCLIIDRKHPEKWDIYGCNLYLVSICGVESHGTFWLQQEYLKKIKTNDKNKSSTG
jgi:hypothetical protein